MLRLPHAGGEDSSAHSARWAPPALGIALKPCGERAQLSASNEAESSLSTGMKSVRHGGGFGSDMVRPRRCSPPGAADPPGAPPAEASISLRLTRSVATVASSDASASFAL